MGYSLMNSLSVRVSGSVFSGDMRHAMHGCVLDDSSLVKEL